MTVSKVEPRSLVGSGVRRAALLVVVAALALTGCARSGQVAATVGDKTIKTSEVDFLTRMQCKAAAATGQAAAASKARVRTDMVNVLVEDEILQAAAADGDGSYDRSTYASVMQQYAPLVDAVPAKDRDRFREFLGGYFRHQLQVREIAARKLSSQGVQNPSEEELAPAVQEIVKRYHDKLHPEINPQFGPDKDGVAGNADSSLSKAVSSFAKQSLKPEPAGSWVSSLPARQRCA